MSLSDQVAQLEQRVALLKTYAGQDAEKIKHLVDMLSGADAALAKCGIGKTAPIRENINWTLKTIG